MFCSNQLEKVKTRVTSIHSAIFAFRIVTRIKEKKRHKDEMLCFSFIQCIPSVQTNIQWATQSRARGLGALQYFHIKGMSSVTRLGDLLHLGQLFKACGNNYFVQIAHIFRQFLKRCQNLSFFFCEIIFGQLLQTFGSFLVVTLIGHE